jgi:ribulose-phosphate 3-epimerase
MKIYPSVLTGSIEEVQKQADIAKQCPDVEVLQLDIIDGFFADNLTISPQNLLEIDFGDLKIDLHLMVEEPMDMMEEVISVKDNLPIRAIVAQVEKMTHQQDFVDDVKKMGLKAGLSLDLYTPVDSLEEGVLDSVDILQFMGIEAGFQGQELRPIVYEKIEKFLKPELRSSLEIIFDGGVTEETAGKLVDLGISSFAVGSTLWKAEDFCGQFRTYLQMGNL